MKHVDNRSVKRSSYLNLQAWLDWRDELSRVPLTNEERSELIKNLLSRPVFTAPPPRMGRGKSSIIKPVKG